MLESLITWWRRSATALSFVAFVTFVAIVPIVVMILLYHFCSYFQVVTRHVTIAITHMAVNHACPHISLMTICLVQVSIILHWSIEEYWEDLVDVEADIQNVISLKSNPYFQHAAAESLVASNVPWLMMVFFIVISAKMSPMLPRVAESVTDNVQVRRSTAVVAITFHCILKYYQHSPI